MTIKRFEDLKCWQAARELVKTVYLICMNTEQLRKDYKTQGQFKSCALSTMNNIAEGFGRYSKKDFVRFLDISKSSACEVKSMTYVLGDIRYITPQQQLDIQQKAEKTKNLTLGLIKYLNKKIEEENG